MNELSELHQDEQAVQQATQIAAASLRKMLTETKGSSRPNTTHISVPEREELIEIISQILPAGNVVGFVLNGILNVKDREIPTTEGRIHFNSLFKGLAIVRNNAFYRMMFAGPATVLAGYNMILRLAGAKPEDFLPDGVWQFYVEFGLREDAARHHTETLGFQYALKAIRPTETQQLTAWVLAAMWLLRDYDYLLANLWEEHVRLTVIEETTGLTGLHKIWQQLRPFSLNDQQTQSIALYRHQRFEAFCEEQLSRVGKEQRYAFEHFWNSTEQIEQREKAIRAYQQQLSLQTFLEAGDYSERRIPIRSSEVCVGIIYEGNYYLLEHVDPTTPTAPALVHAQIQSILQNRHSQNLSGADRILVESPRISQNGLRKTLGKEQQKDIQELRKAPILINWDLADRNQPLSAIRQGQRGLGDHCLTLFRTNHSMVFDFSHIYFDGPWAMETAELLTNEAIKQLHHSAAMQSTLNPPPIRPLDLRPTSRLERHATKTSPVINYISGEASLPLTPISDLRKIFLSRTKPMVHVTVNDLLVLFRTVFNQCYQTSPPVDRALNDFRKKADKTLVHVVDVMLANLKETNPSLLIPIDAGRVNPKDRIFPSTFRSPLPDFYRRHTEVLMLLHNANRGIFNRGEKNQIFHDARQEYLSTLAAFGEIMRRYRNIAIEGESMSTTAIRLIAGLPGAMQRLADGLPGHFSFINEAIKGEEVFSNVGQVTPGSSLSRFASAKDDNDKKVLVWGIMSDNNNTLYITLRDFRPAVHALAHAGYASLSQAITQDFVEAYAREFQKFIVEVHSVVAAPKS